MAEFSTGVRTAKGGSHHESNRLRAEGLGYLQLCLQAQPHLYIKSTISIESKRR